MSEAGETRVGEVPQCARVFLARLAERSARVGVIGLGYVGLPLVLRFVRAGFKVTGFDVDAEKVATLEAGGSYILSIAAKSIAEARAQGFEATTEFARIGEQDAVLICVPTPLDAKGEPDLSFVEQTARSIAPHLRAGQLVVLESTTYPGTTEEIVLPALEAGCTVGLRAAKDGASASEDVFFVGYSPEREDPGNPNVDFAAVPKVVAGVDRVGARLAVALYRTVVQETVEVSSTRTAEMTKLLENIYRSVNIALVNELKMLAMRMGIDIWEVIAAAKTKPFGFQAFYPGPGLGGHCIPVDPFYLSWKAREFGFETRFIELSGEINRAMPEFVVRQTGNALASQGKTLVGAKVLVLGVSYKKDVDDLRESPALALMELYQRAGAEVEYHDPYHPYVGKGRHYDVQRASVPLERMGEFDCVVIATDHSVLDAARIAREARLVVDTRNAMRGIAGAHIFRC